MTTVCRYCSLPNSLSANLVFAFSSGSSAGARRTTRAGILLAKWFRCSCAADVEQVVLRIMQIVWAKVPAVVSKVFPQVIIGGSRLRRHYWIRQEISRWEVIKIWWRWSAARRRWITNFPHACKITRWKIEKQLWLVLTTSSLALQKSTSEVQFAL